MDKSTYLKQIIATLGISEETSFTYDEKAILKEYTSQEATRSSLLIKILSIIGGFIGCFTFFGFLMIAGLYDSGVGMLIFGLSLLIISIWMNKTNHQLIIDTLSICTYVVGYILVFMGLAELDINANIVILIGIIIAITSLILLQTYLLSFLAVLVISGCLFAFIETNNLDFLIHAYNALLVISLTYFILFEAQIISNSKKLSLLYNPIRIGLVFSFIAGLIAVGKKELLDINADYIWLSSIASIIALCYITKRILGILKITDTSKQALFYILTLLVLGSIILAPAILGSLLILLLCFLVNYKTGFVIGILALIYFICQYYYDLNFTLLTKSIILFVSGVLFLFFYFLSHKKVS